ncbi:MAG: proton-conducting transporter membrane subunit [Elusimicrobiota bacterium]|nr:proton-conducting transporter membrane subunit [Elusimicrobiota bacterium]
MNALFPSAALAAGVLGSLGLGFLPRRAPALLRVLAVLSLGSALLLLGRVGEGAALPPLIASDALALAWQSVILLAALPMALWLDSDDARAALFLGSTLGMLLLASASNLLMLFVGLEFMSLPAYLLVVRSRGDEGRRLEAATKYFFAGGVGGALFLLGMALWYAQTRSLGPSALLVTGGAQAGLALMGACALFKIGAVPLHFWLPDAYEASDPEVAGFFSTAMKAAAVLLLMRLCRYAPGAAFAAWLPAVGALTALVGAVMALRQERLARLLAYSSVSHAGLLILGVGAWAARGLPPEGVSALLFYLAAYAFMSNGAFAFLRASGARTRADLAGYARRSPALAAAFAALLFSLAGIPPTGGFFAKLLVLWQSVQSGLLVPAGVAALAALVSLGFYLGLVRALYLEEPAGEGPRPGPGAGLTAALAAGAVLLGLAPWALAGGGL